MKNNNIAFIIHGLRIGGAEMFFINLVNGFSKNNYKINAIILDDNNPLLENLCREIKITSLPRSHKFDIGIIFKLKKIIEAENITTVFCLEPFSFLITKLALINKKNVKFYLSIHNSLPIYKKKYLLDISILKLFGKCDHAIFICKKQRDIFKKLYHFQPKLNSIIYNGVNTDYFSRHSVEKELSASYKNWKNRLRIAENEKTILLVGRLSIEKGHLYAINALSILHKQYKFYAHLIIIGGGEKEMENKIMQAADNSDVKNYIHFTGRQKDVRPYLLYGDLFTLTSFSETFSMAALEAMSMGTPCSLSDVGGASEMIGNEIAGNLSEARNPKSIADSWNKILIEKFDKEKIAEYTNTYFSLNKMIKNYVDLIESESTRNS